jgi:transcriptional regulator with GAF, ATPase, and Fis domain
LRQRLPPAAAAGPRSPHSRGRRAHCARRLRPFGRRALLHAGSRRAHRPFVAINCSAIPAGLAEAELFGHERGAFTGALRQHEGCFERAAGGTLFLDEITEMPMELQAKLLRVLESGRLQRVGGSEEIAFDVRVIAATNRNP